MQLNKSTIIFLIRLKDAFKKPLAIVLLLLLFASFLFFVQLLFFGDDQPTPKPDLSKAKQNRLHCS